MDATAQKSWRERFAEELSRLEPVLTNMGFRLEVDQPHLSGERFLMTRNKLVLSGIHHDGTPVIIKAANHIDGKNEINKEKTARDLLASVSFAKDIILFPKEIYYGEMGGYLFIITEYVPQEKVFVSHSLEEQFFLILRAFEEQEAFHATTFEHFKDVAKSFETSHARGYYEEFGKIKDFIKEKLNDLDIDRTLEEAYNFLLSNKRNIGIMCGSLTHTDFVPHNFRIRGRDIYTLDLSAIRFGNRHESWARFLNYMVIHNPPLEKALVEYLRENRSEIEYISLRSMRVYKVGLLLEYYTKSLEKTTGDLRELTLERIGFWHEILKFLLKNEEIPDSFVEDYKKKRDNLRSEEEKKRQREFAVA